jgi:hypothetical protein
MKSHLKLPTLLALLLLLAACAQAGAPPAASTNASQPANPTADDPSAPVVATPIPSYPGPSSPADTPPSARPDRTTRYAPQPGDDLLERGNVFIEEYGILTLESYPPQFMLHVTGNLPTPCNELRAVASEPGKDGRIDVEVYSVTDPGAMCAQVLVPFEANIPLGSYTEGSYPVTINGDLQVGVIEPGQARFLR